MLHRNHCSESMAVDLRFIHWIKPIKWFACSFGGGILSLGGPMNRDHCNLSECSACCVRFYFVFGVECDNIFAAPSTHRKVSFFVGTVNSEKLLMCGLAMTIVIT